MEDAVAEVYDRYREDVAGRANVQDTPELIAYYRRLEELGTGALWTVANKIEPWEPASTSIPMIWRYHDLREDVLKALELVSPEQRSEEHTSELQSLMRITYA